MKNNIDKIKIPWYNVRVQRQSYEEFESEISNGNWRIPNPKINRPRPQPQDIRVRQPSYATQPSTETAKQPSLEPNLQPNLEPNTQQNPFGETDLPFPFPLPRKLPNPFPNPYGQGRGTLTPQPVMTDTQTKWINNFTSNVKIVAMLTNQSTKYIYDYIANYDFQTNTLEQFKIDTEAKFGAVVATVLFVAILGKELGKLWGKRLGRAFSLPFTMDDDFYNEYFGNDKIEF